ncbi:MAG TPA: hypothetical protein VJT33_03210 [bacterium]|nr:hypothetical protein [bacterium]
MRQRILLVLVVIAAIVPLAAGHPWRPAVGGSSVIPGVALADIPIGAPIGEVLNRFGSPSVVRLTGGDGLLGYGFDRYGITVYAHGDLVQAVATTNSVLGGVNGIALGAPLSDVVRAFGQRYSRGAVEGYPGVVYGGAGVAFGMDHGAVAAILVFRPAAAVPAQPGAPSGNGGPVTSQEAPGSPVAASTDAAVALMQPAPAQTVAAAPPAAHSDGGLPDLSGLKAYTSATHYLSISGYLRYLVHDTSKTWITPDDSDRLMRGAQRLTQP